MLVTRFAPSPTGPLHLGHAFSALTIQRLAGPGRVLLRIEDTDSGRARPAFADAIVEDLTWLGFRWQGEVRLQSRHRADHQGALDALAARGLLYPCGCTRREIADAGGTVGAHGMVYPGTCRGRSMDEARPGDAIRLDVRRALNATGPLPPFTERGPIHTGVHAVTPEMLRDRLGDPVLRRRDSGDMSYDLACPFDDAAQGVSHVIRGVDLWENTALHVLLQTVMGWPVPVYVHHTLVTDASGRRLAKVDRSKAIARYREEGLSPQEVIARLPPLPVKPLAP